MDGRTASDPQRSRLTEPLANRRSDILSGVKRIAHGGRPAAFSLAVLVPLLLVAACGIGDPGAEVTDATIASAVDHGAGTQTTQPTIEVTETSSVDAAPREATPATAPPDASLIEGTPPEGSANSDASALLLNSLLATANEVGPYRVSTSTGQVVRSTALGVDQVQELNPSRPTMVAEVAPNGDSNIFVDLGPLFAASAGGNPEVAAALDQTSLELWISAETLVIDATGYQPIADLNPTAELGPFEPGIGVIDLKRIGDIGGRELLEALVGSGVVDPVILAENLPNALDDITQDPADPLLFTAKASYAAALQAQGADLESATRAVAVGIAPAIGVSVDELAGFYQRYYESLPAQIAITLDGDGALVSFGVTADLSSVYQAIGSPDSGIDVGMSDDELADFRELFADTLWIIESVTTFEFDDSIVIVPPSGDYEDRTDKALEFFAELVPG